jgi:arylsulfatase A-like enzyme
VPLLIKWPAGWPRLPELRHAGQLDVVPTILEALGAPASAVAEFPGRSWLSDPDGTVIQTTQFAGRTGEAMIWRRGGYEAAFGWPHYWDPQIPASIRLLRLAGPNGPMALPESTECDAILRRHFPDAIARIFASFELDSAPAEN